MLLKKTELRKSFGHLGAFAIGQGIQMLTSIARVPAIASTSNLEVLGASFLWLNFQSWVSVFTAGVSNGARLSVVTNSSPIRTNRKIYLPIFWASLVLTPLVLFVPSVPAWMGGLTPTLLAFATGIALASHVGVLQGMGRVNLQFMATAGGSIATLFLTVLVTQSSYWGELMANQQVFVLSLTSFITFASPYVTAALVAKAHNSASSKSVKGAASGESRFVADVSALLPPAFVTGFDTLALATTSNLAEVVEYGVVSRISLLTTAVASALYIQVFNRASSRDEHTIRKSLGDATFLSLLNIPFLVCFILFANPLATLLSDGKSRASELAVLGVVLIAVVLPFWLTISASVNTSDSARLVLGNRILKIVFPTGLTITFALAYFLGASGPMFSSALTYLLATLLAIDLLKIRNKRT